MRNRSENTKNYNDMLTDSRDGFSFMKNENLLDFHIKKNINVNLYSFLYYESIY